MSCLLETERLLLRPPERRDIPALVPLANDYDVAKNLSKLPHPYTAAHGEAFVAEMQEKRVAGSDFTFAITLRSDGAFMGCIGLHLKDGSFEFGYWLGQKFWRQGYATEAARALVAFAFHDLKAESVWAGWYHDNPRSGHVLTKLGCVPKGFERRACLARGMDIGCNVVTLSRDAFLGRRAA
ncbi:MAG TPA: GNAT family N-acetyltransferase [Rhizomicrobium sp.]|jgi:ribosomal-protein-alanine N-acetyltransferase|nr:GNAT family N-acetyltransferase [Rhizomicrobium sp.]